MAAWLAYLKSQLLLPPAERELGDAEAIAEDLGERLRRLEALRQRGGRLAGAARGSAASGSRAARPSRHAVTVTPALAGEPGRAVRRLWRGSCSGAHGRR